MNRTSTKCILAIAFFVTMFNLSFAQTAGNGLTLNGKTYATVIIDGREWMAENLATTQYIGGYEYQVSPTLNHFIENGWGDSSIIAPMGGIENGRGYLYNRNAIYEAGETIAPAGWHVPTQIEWQSLIAYIQGNDLRKEDGVEVVEDYWACAGNNNDFYNFSAIATGLIDIDPLTPDPTTTNSGFIASFWTSTTYYDESGVDQTKNFIARISCLNGATPLLNASFAKHKDSGLAVRLIKDAPLSNDTFNKIKVSVYPNPIKMEFRIQSSENINSIEIYDLLGKKVFSESHVSDAINVGDMMSGVYIIKVYTDSGVFNSKIIKE